MHFIVSYGLPNIINPQAKIFVFCGDDILFYQNKNELSFLHDVQASYLKSDEPQCYLGQLNDIPLYALSLSSPPVGPHLQLRSLKIFLSETDDFWFQLLCRAKQIVQWNEVSRYCGRCGGKTSFSTHELSKICAQCNHVMYVYYSPAVLVLIQRDREILLARSPHFRPGHYSLLAGFVEPGESTEQTAHREVDEEVGLKIKQLEFFGTAQWPFPNSFMVAYKAQYDAGEIKMHPTEIEDAQWFSLDNLPDLPYKASLSRKLIDSVL